MSGSEIHDVAIVGAGPAGLAAAARLNALGVRDVVVLEREQQAGGVPRHCGHTGFGLREFRRLLAGPAYSRRLVAGVNGVEVRTGASVLRLDPGGRLQIVGRDGPTTLTARRVLLALGTRETPRSARLVGGTRPWGVLTTGALQQLVFLAGVRPFERAVIVGTELVSFSVLLTLRHAGIDAVAMLEEGARIVARRPGAAVARTLFGTPVLTRTRLVAILGDRRVEGVEIETDGQHRRLACDGVVFTGQFVPEAALLAPSHLALDPRTGGPVIDQAWRCSDPAYFAAGNLLRPVETAGTCWAEGRAAAEAIAASLNGAPASNRPPVAVTFDAPIRYVYPQRIAPDGGALTSLLLRIRFARTARGRLALMADGRELWSRAGTWLPERRVTLPGERIDPQRLETLHIAFQEL